MTVAPPLPGRHRAGPGGRGEGVPLRHRHAREDEHGEGEPRNLYRRLETLAIEETCLFVMGLRDTSLL